MCNTAFQNPKIESEKIGLKRRNNTFFITYDGKNVGFGQIQRVKNREKCVELIALNIREDLRNRGLGTNLLQYIIEISRMKGFKSLVIFAKGRCISLYQRFGFDPSGEKEDELVMNL